MTMAETEQEEWLPGTSRLIEEQAQAASSHLQRHGDIVLLPQPTTSPNDPLNWSLFRKYWHAFLLCFITALTAATSNDAGAAGDALNTDYGISYNALNTGAGVLFAGIGYFTLLISPAAWLYGRRVTYLVCLTLGVIGAIWFARSNTTEDSIWNQLFVGASEACAEANVQLSLSEIFFQHQIGSVIGVYVLATSIGTFLGPLIAGFIADRLDWQWIGWMSVVISCVTIAVTYFTLEETLFDRSAYNGPVIDGVQETNGDNASETEKKVSSNRASDPNPESQIEPKKSYWQRIQLITLAPNVKGTGFKQYMTRLIHTLRVFSFPAVLFAGLQWGAQDAWLTFYLTLEENNCTY
jgi:MFS family permease